MKGATHCIRDDHPTNAISIHAPVKGATRANLRKRATGHFNPRSREGSDLYGQRLVQDLGISIHAPVKGATLLRLLCRPWLRNFNPRSREGSDTRAWCRAGLPRYFNPRSREGSDVVTDDGTRVRDISIHAPVKGATVHKH